MPPESSPLAKTFCDQLGNDTTEGSSQESEGKNLMQWEITTQKHMKNKNKIKEQMGRT
jgi:hypothetical protein